MRESGRKRCMREKALDALVHRTSQASVCSRTGYNGKVLREPAWGWEQAAVRLVPHP